MNVEGISLGYMEMEMLSGLRTFACEGRSNGGVMFGMGGHHRQKYKPCRQLRINRNGLIVLCRMV